MNSILLIGPSMVVGSCYLVLVSLVTLASFVVMCVNPYFNGYFSTFFLIFGALFLSKVAGERSEKLTTNQIKNYEPYYKRKSILLSDEDNRRLSGLLQTIEWMIASCIFLAGVCVVFLEKDWYAGVPNWAKIVPLGLIGISINAIAISILLFVLEELKYWFDLGSNNTPTPLVVSNVMYLWALIISICIGIN